MDKLNKMKSWKYQSTNEVGFHKIIQPSLDDCSELNIFRLNLENGTDYTIKSNNLELNGVVIDGCCKIKSTKLDTKLEKFDSFFISANNEIKIKAKEKLIMYIAGAEGFTDNYQKVRKFNWGLPLGKIHQIHGSGVGEREVMFTCEPDLPANKLICGLTWSRPGTWTSWPPHQHEKYLEEAYCYFDMDNPKMGLHLSYLKSGERENMVVHQVQSGTMILAPYGYHPTVAMPNTQNAYFWAMAAFNHSDRRYDLAKEDPELINEK